MSLEDPFFVVRDEVVNALTKSRNYYQRWSDFQDDPNCGTKEELDWTTTELRNGLRSIEWDLEDLEETIGIVENNPKKFKLDETEINNRRKFITQTKEEVKFMREKLFDSKSTKDKKMMRQSGGQTIANTSSLNGAKYTRLQNNFDSPHKNQESEIGINIDENIQQQQFIIKSQDETLNKLRDSVGTLKSISRHIGTEVDEHAVMLDELGNEIEITDSRLDTTLKKISRVLHLSNDRRQWMAIGLLICIIIIITFIAFL